MKEHIINFPSYLLEGVDIAASHTHHLPKGSSFNKLLFVGMGGSGMAAQLIKTMVDGSDTGIPCYVVNEYKVPQWVDESTIMIVASYSGNTEETIHAMHDGLQKGATMVAVTSGGELLSFAKEKGQAVVTMPTGIEPRAALPYSFAIQIAVAKKLGYIDTPIEEAFVRLKDRVSEHQAHIQKQAETLADHIHNCMPVIYATPEFTGLSLRFRQQLNENSRMLCRDHIIPEMNHNELLGRQEGNKHVKVIFFTDNDISSRNKKRIELSKQVIHERGTPYFDLPMQGNTLLQKMISGIYTIDRISYYAAIKRGVDPNSMEIITRLKGELKK